MKKRHEQTRGEQWAEFLSICGAAALYALLVYFILGPMIVRTDLPAIAFGSLMTLYHVAVSAAFYGGYCLYKKAKLTPVRARRRPPAPSARGFLWRGHPLPYDIERFRARMRAQWDKYL